MDPCNMTQLRTLLDQYGFQFSKSKGQNFLIDPSVPDRIAASACDGASCVLEIGPGVGSLTSRLCQASPQVVAIEKDRSLEPLLRETMAGFDNLRVVYDDALKLDLRGLTAREFPGQPVIVCANLPYYITTPIITALLEARCFQSLTLMVQKEVAQRICADAGTGDYGAFSVFCRFYAQPRTLFLVPPDCFMPRPKVTSAVIRLDCRSEPPCPIRDESWFFRVVRASFNQRRKTLVNGLATGFPQLSKAELTDLVTGCGYPADIRGEKLDLAGFAQVANAIYDRVQGS